MKRKRVFTQEGFYVLIERPNGKVVAPMAENVPGMRAILFDSVTHARPLVEAAMAQGFTSQVVPAKVTIEIEYEQGESTRGKAT